MENEQETNTSPSLPITQAQIEQIKGLLSGGESKSIAADGISSVLSNPELLSKLPQVMELLKPMLGQSSPPSAPTAPSHEEERDRLLLSLRPFLSKERQETLEAILKLSKLGEILKQLS